MLTAMVFQMLPTMMMTTTVFLTAKKVRTELLKPGGSRPKEILDSPKRKRLVKIVFRCRWRRSTRYA